MLQNISANVSFYILVSAEGRDMTGYSIRIKHTTAGIRRKVLHWKRVEAGNGNCCDALTGSQPSEWMTPLLLLLLLLMRAMMQTSAVSDGRRAWKRMHDGWTDSACIASICWSSQVIYSPSEAPELPANNHYIFYFIRHSTTANKQTKQQSNRKRKKLQIQDNCIY